MATIPSTDGIIQISFTVSSSIGGFVVDDAIEGCNDVMTLGSISVKLDNIDEKSAILYRP